ncbi:hypothetical protein swp_3311 [Shewanella piezotolerans WP3]|uniref:Uncharacterized protein n=1 Tax=Shewanella piezotolerans (strain WP3 / JCM 13877) TaxID=225849 RepID=B8CRK5_SHEPW|nr:hypothetical protein swp_3311 [Shewanella piezotolerans WP3]
MVATASFTANLLILIIRPQIEFKQSIVVSEIGFT